MYTIIAKKYKTDNMFSAIGQYHFFLPAYILALFYRKKYQVICVRNDRYYWRVK